MHASLMRAATTAGLVGGLLAAAAPHAQAAAAPNLTVERVGGAPASVAEGTRFAVTDVVRNRGRGRAAESTVRYYLSVDPRASARARRASTANPRTSPTDIRLLGARTIGAIAAGARQAARRGTTLEVPPGTPAGRYTLLACADDRGVVRETQEHDNCTAARSSATVAPLATAPEPIRSVRELGATFEDSDEGVLAGLVRHEWCAVTRPRALTLTQALERTTAELRRTAGADALGAFKASPAYRSADAAQSAAAGAIVAGSPGAALAALLRAHALQPREASHLMNAAGVATSIGLPNEALAMLDAAARLDDPDRSPMGIPRQAMLEANRAQALVRTGRLAQATAAAGVSARLAPELTEARTAEAAADLCSGRPMLPAWRRAQTRPPHTPPVPPHPLPPETPWVDDATGKPGTFRELPLPATPLQAPPMSSFYTGLEHKELSWITARNGRESSLRSTLGASHAPEAEQAARSEVLDVVARIHEAPDLRALRKTFGEELDAAAAARTELFGSGDDPGRYGAMQDAAVATCMGAEQEWESCLTSEIRSACVPVAGSLHSVWLRQMSAAARTAAAYQAEYGRRISGTAAHLSDPSAYALALLPITDSEHGLRALLVQEAGLWTGGLHAMRDSRDVHRCVADPEPPATYDEGTEADPAGPGPCQGDVKSVNLVVPLPFATLKANCEEIALEASSEGWIAGFAEIKYDYRGNTITVFGGAKAEAGLEYLKGDFKSGMYVKVGMDGIEDAGLRAGPSWTVGAGPLEFNPSGTIDMSFVGAFGTGT